MKTISAGLLCAALLAPCALLADYAKEFNVKFTGYAGSTTLTNFPALIRLSKARNDFDYSKCKLADGGDTRFFDANGNLLPSEVDTWNPDGESLVWVSVPELNKDTVITVRYGNADAPAVTATDVWTNGYVAVWHMNAAEGTFTQKDSTTTGKNISPHASYRNGILCGVEGAVGAAAELGRDGATTGAFHVSDRDGVLDGFPAMTLELWTYQTAYRSDANSYLINKLVPSPTTNAYNFYQLKNTSGKVASYFYKTDGGNGDIWQSSGTGAQLNEWTHQVARWSGTSGRRTCFMNCVSVYDNTKDAAKGIGKHAGPGSSLYIGNNLADQWGNSIFRGKIDEVRISSVARSDDWVVATHDTIANEDFAVFEMPNDWMLYTHKFSIAFPGVTEDATLDDFPVLVKVSEAGIPGFRYADCAKDGGADLRFTDGNSSTPLPCEVEVWDTNGVSLVWVKVPTLTRSTRITGYYGWILAPAVDPTEVWDANFVGVWHMNAAEGTFTQKNSTAIGKNVTAPSDYRAGILCGVNGVVGAAAELGRDGVRTGCFQVADGGTDLDGFSGITLEAWTFQTSYPSYTAYLISKMAPSPWSQPYQLSQRNNGQLTGVLYTSANGYCDVWPGSGANPQFNEWTHQSFRWDGNTGKRTGFINGSSVTEKSSGSNVTGVGLHNANAALTIGNSHYSKDVVFPGKIDEVRISKVARSDAWVKATYDTIADNETFTRYGNAGANIRSTVVIFR